MPLLMGAFDRVVDRLSAAPKSSAVTIRLLQPSLRDDHVFAVAQELEEFHALAQAAHQHVARGEHLAHDLGDLGGAEIELLVEILHRLEDFGMAEMRIVERRDLGAVIGQQIHIAGEPAIFLGLLVEEGARIGRRQRHLHGARIDFLGEGQGFLDGFAGLARQAQDEGAMHHNAQIVAILGEALGDLDQQALLDVVQDLLVAGFIADQQAGEAAVLHHFQRLARHIGLGVARPDHAQLAQFLGQLLRPGHDCRSACRRRRRFPSPAGNSLSHI